MKYPFLIGYDKLINVLSNYLDTDDYFYKEVNRHVFTLNDYDITVVYNKLDHVKVISQLTISSLIDFFEGFRIFRIDDEIIIEGYKSREVVEYSEDNVINSLMKLIIKCDPSIRNTIIDSILE